MIQRYCTSEQYKPLYWRRPLNKHDELYIKELLQELIDDPRRKLIDEVITCIEELIDDAYEAGLEAGDHNGFESGYECGWDSGQEEGQAEGFEEGHAAGLDEAKWGREND